MYNFQTRTLVLETNGGLMSFNQSRWTPEEESYLQEIWETHTKAEILEVFQGRSWDSLRKKAYRMGCSPHPASGFQSSDADMLKHLYKRGYNLQKQPQPSNKKIKINSSRYLEGKLYKIGVVSDTHLCNTYQQLTHLRTIYGEFARQGISEVLHPGDIVDGQKMYRGQEYHLFAQGADAQTEYAINNYPCELGITTYAISGNHDLSFLSNAGYNVVRRICSLRDDMEWVGDEGAYVELPGGLVCYLNHGAGSMPKSRSLKLQQGVDALGSYEEKPDLYIMGHYHIQGWWHYQGVACFYPGCFEGRTDFMLKHKLYPQIGGWILEYRIVGGETVSFKSQWLPFKEILNDY
jgi:predicted phosphodiesterase